MHLDISRLSRAAVLAVVLVGVSGAGAQPDYWIAGIWKTSEGRMVIKHSHPDVSGEYAQDGGRIIGTLDGQVLTGFWIENGSGVTCDTARDGSVHWGRIVFTFDEAFASFAGKWGYCDQAPTRNWTGTLEAAAKTLLVH